MLTARCLIPVLDEKGLREQPEPLTVETNPEVPTKFVDLWWDGHLIVVRIKDLESAIRRVVHES